MKSIQKVALAGIVLLYLSAVLLPLKSDDPKTWQADKWVQWRDTQIQRILEPTFDSNGEKLISREEVILRAADAYRFIAPLLEDPNFLKDEKRSKILSNFVLFIKAQNLMSIKNESGVNSHALGFEVTDKEYWKYASASVDFPEILKSQEFLNYMTSPATYKLGIDMIDKYNLDLPEERKWIVLPFRAQFIKSVDKTTYGRMLVLVPNELMSDGEIADKWILFSIATPDLDPATEIKSVSMITVKRKNSDATEHKAYLVDFMREKTQNGRDIDIVPTFLMASDPSKNCYDCHKSSVLPIHPKAEYIFDEAGRMIENPRGLGTLSKEVNSRIMNYGPADLGPFNANAYGPSLGPIGRLRSDEFIADATKSKPISPNSYSRIKAAMNCSMCHNGFAKLNYLQAVRSNRDVRAFESGKGMVQTYIEEGWMPPANTLSADERHALWQCLTKEYFDHNSGTGIFIDWLKGLEGH